MEPPDGDTKPRCLKMIRTLRRRCVARDLTPTAARLHFQLIHRAETGSSYDRPGVFSFKV